jgi:uncharacterized protein YggE
MRRLLIALALAAGALVAAGVLGSAGAQAPAPASAQRLITVNGGGEANVAADAKPADRQAAYRTALSAALDDAKAKADFVAQHEGVTLGAVQSVTEQSNSVLSWCAVPYAAGGAVKPAIGAPVPRPLVRPRRHRSRRRPAAPPQIVQPVPPRCPVQAAVTVAYAIA